MSLFISKKYILVLLFLAVSCLLAEQETWNVAKKKDGQGYTVGSCEVLNPNIAKSKDGLWRHFMHGITDQKAIPMAWNPLLNPAQEKYLDINSTIEIPEKSSDLASIKLSNGEKIELSLPVLDKKQIKAKCGKYLRFFIWIKGEETGKGDSLWDNAPSVRFTLYDGDGDIRKEYTPLFHTRGSFPWHCYYIDIEVPAYYQDAPLAQAKPSAHKPGLFVTLSNPTSGIAYFSTLSCQEIDKDKTLAAIRNKNRIADPLTGSLAPNPDYDELPMHFLLGLPDKYAWHFLQGTKSQPDITRLAEMEKYQAEFYKDWFHTIFVYTKLPYIDAYLKQTKSPIQFEKGCMELLLERVLDAQMVDNTNLWCVNEVPNLFLSAAVISQMFAPVQPKRADRTQAVKTPWYSVNGQSLRQADVIINSLLKAQKKAGNPQRLAGWNNFTFNKSAIADHRFDSPFDFPATVAATTILYYAIPKAKPENTARAQAAIRQCWEYVMEYMLNEDGTWKTTYNQAYPTPSYDFFQFIEHTPYLEFRCNSKLTPVKTTATYKKGTATFTWKRSPSAVALRIFIAPANAQPSQLTEANLIAIAQPSTKNFGKMDPILALRQISLAAHKKWNVIARDANTPYVLEKIMATHAVKAIDHDGTITIPYVTTIETPMVIYLAEVMPYGEMTPFTKLQQEIKPPETEGTAAPKTEAPKNDTPAPVATKPGEVPPTK